MKQITEQEAYLRLAALCAQGEHCQYEMAGKMQRWGLNDDAQSRVLERLIQERYVDDERFTRAFIKYNMVFNKWGRRKIEQSLWQKHINEDIRQRCLDDVADEEYLAILRPLLKQKRKSTKAKNDYELNQKLMRFALGRGFTYDLIRQCIDIAEFDEDELLEQIP